MTNMGHESTGGMDQVCRTGMTAIQCACCLVILATGCARAEGRQADDTPFGTFVESTSLEQLAEMVVTDSKREQRSSRATQHYIVLKDDDMHQMPVENGNLSDLMRYASGQFVNVLSRSNPNWGSYGGLGARYNSYLLDGVPIDSMVHPIVLDLNAIERIEMQKGPASVLYSSYLSQDFIGSQTPLAGTTNFVLKGRVDQSRTRVSLGAGNHGATRVGASSQGHFDQMGYILGFGQEHGGETQVGDPGSWLQTTTTPADRKDSLFLNLRYAFDRPGHALSVFWQRTDHDGNQGRPYRGFEHRYDVLNVAYENILTPEWDVQLKLGRRDADRTFQNDDYPSGLALVNDERTYQRVDLADLSFSHRHLQNSLLTLGINRQRVDYKTSVTAPTGITSPQNDAESDETAFFVQEKLQFDRWTLRAGARHNQIDAQYHLLGGMSPQYSGAIWRRNLWSFGVRHETGDRISLYANAGSSFTTPTAKQVGGTVAAGAALSGQIGNPALKPESGVGHDLGLDWMIARDLTLNVRLFLNQVEDMIVTSVVSSLPSQISATNAGRASSRGVELDVHHDLSAATQLFSNMTLIRSRVSHPDDPDQDGAQIPFVPSRIVNAGIRTVVAERVQLSGYFQWIDRYYDSSSLVSRQPYGRFGVVGARLQMPLAVEAGTATRLTLDLNNLTNRHYAMPFSFRSPGFSGFLGIEARY